MSLRNLQAAIAAFEREQERHSHLGAQDTEPDGVFQSLLVRTYQRFSRRIPETPRDWELYSEEPGADAAARCLTSSLLTCLEALKAIPLDEFDATRKYLESYCWRVEW